MWRWFLGVAALPSAIVAVAYRLLPESPRFLQVMGRHDEALEVSGVFETCDHGCVTFVFLQRRNMTPCGHIILCATQLHMSRRRRTSIIKKMLL